MENVQVQDIEIFLNKIIGVLNSRIVENHDNQIIEIHILANNQRSAKQIIRDIQSLLMAQFNIKIDHKIISIAQVFEKEENLNNPRLIIKGIEYASYNMTGKAKVTLEYDENVFIGDCEGIHSSTQSCRLIAQATLNAVEQFLDNSLRFNVEEIKVVNIADRKIVISGVYLVNKNTEKLLIGNCIVENDINNATTKAVLDAVNRLLEVK